MERKSNWSRFFVMTLMECCPQICGIQKQQCDLIIIFFKDHSELNKFCRDWIVCSGVWKGMHCMKGNINLFMCLPKAWNVQIFHTKKRILTIKESISRYQYIVQLLMNNYDTAQSNHQFIFCMFQRVVPNDIQHLPYLCPSSKDLCSYLEHLSCCWQDCYLQSVVHLQANVVK